MPSIVTLNVSEQVAPTPSTLQQTGALISQGGTTLTEGSFHLLTQISDLTAIQPAALALTSLTWTAEVVTATAEAAHDIPVGHEVEVTIAGASPAGYNGTFLATATTTTAFTYPLASNPGAETTPGTWTPGSVSEVMSMCTTYFGEGTQQAVYVLELGLDDSAIGIAALQTFIEDSPAMFYAYCVPRSWAADETYPAFLEQYDSPSSMTYFFTTPTIENYTNFTDLEKCVFAQVEAPSIPSTEFSIAADFQALLRNNPSATNQVSPFAFTYLFGVTPYPTQNNNTLLTTLQEANVNYVGTGAEGGISDALVWRGTTMDGMDLSQWYSIDWVQINCKQALANAVINGSNNPINPLYYDQDGIDRLQQVLATTMSNGVSFGMVLGAPVITALDGPTLDAALNAGTYANQTVINAIPFTTYSNENPGDYKEGLYKGFSVIFVTKRGFIQIVLNLVVSEFVSA